MSEQNINIEITQTQPSTITTEQYKLLSGVVGGGLPFLFDIDPGNFTAPLDGTFVLNNVNPLTATKIAISYNTKDGVDCSEWIKLVTSSGRLFINRYSDPVCYAAFSISNITDKTTWIEFDISNLVLLGWTKLQDQNTCYITLLSGADSGNTLIGYTGVADHLNFLGDRAGDNSDGSGDSNFIGTAAGEGAKRSINCNYFGDEAGRFLEDGYDCIGIGDAAFWGSLGIEGSVALGNFIAGLCDNINYSVFIGRYAAANAFFAEKAVFIGEHAGENARNAAKAIFIGYNAGNQIADYDVNNRQIDVKYISPKIRFNGCYPNNPGNLNDLHLGTSEYSGVYPEVIYTITIYTVGDIDTFVWADNQGNSYDPDISGLLYITGEDQLIAEGVYIKFNNLTGHMVSDQWVIKAFDAHMEGGAPICIGIDSSSGGFLGSIVMGENAVNTKALQFLIGSQYKYIQLRGVDYELPSELGNVGDVLTIDDISGKLVWAAGGGSGGHVIQDNGTPMAAQPNLDFIGFTVENDVPNTRTKITHIPTDISSKQDTANLSTNVVTDAASNTKYPSVKAIKDYADGLVVGLIDDRGNYDASVNTFPASGGSGTAGAILKGDLWYISVAGTLGGVAVTVGSSLRALVDTPAQTATNWDILNVGLGYVPANDTAVIHKATAAEISAMTDKATPVDADVLMIEDSATTPTAFGKKKLTWSNLKTTLGSLFVSKVAGSSLTPDTEISKIHSQNTDTGTTQQTFSLFSGSILGRWLFSIVTGAGNFLLTLQNAVLTANRTQTYQNDDGTIALTKNIPLAVDIKLTINGQNNIILAGNYGGYYKIPYAGTITGWVLYEGSSTPIATTTVLDVWKKSSFYPTVADTIFGTKPSLTAATNNSATGLNIAVAAGDIFAFNVDSNSAGKILNFMLLITKS